MRYLTVLVVLAALFIGDAMFSSADSAIAQTQTSAAEKAASLRAQLTEVETKQTELQTRLQNLDEAMKPENIEGNLAGVGSTKPEDLREQRRRQLEIERNGVQKQIDLLATSHTRLETAIAQADVDAYRQSAAPVTAPATSTSSGVADSTGATTAPARPRRARRKKAKKSTRLPSPASSSLNSLHNYLEDFAK